MKMKMNNNNNKIQKKQRVKIMKNKKFQKAQWVIKERNPQRQKK